MVSIKKCIIVLFRLLKVFEMETGNKFPNKHKKGIELLLASNLVQ